MSALATVLAVAGVLTTAWAVPAALAWACIYCAARLERSEAGQ